MSAVWSITDSYAFHDAHLPYTLESFGEYATDYKRSFFNKDLAVRLVSSTRSSHHLSTDEVS